MTLFSEVNLPEYFNLENYRSALISWGQTHFRDFPWRHTSDPYHVLLAEILLHRTQAKQVVEIYLMFVTRYPSISALNTASYEELAILLKPLGLYWRINLIVLMAEELVNRFEATVPEDRDDLLSLPGVGDYIASSVRCFAFDKPDAIIDTNVVRVITRLLGISHKDSLRRKRSFQELAQSLIDPDNPQAYNYAILDLANLVCRPRIPNCQICLLQDSCKFYRQREG